MSICLLQPKDRRSGFVHSKKTYFGVGKWWIGIGYQWLELGGFKCPVSCGSCNVFSVDIWYLTASFYKRK